MISKTVKMRYLIILILFLFAVHHAGAGIIRVNNNTGIPGVYVTLAAAVADAAAGDTIHIEGSVTPYTGNVTVQKKVVIIGPGYLLSSTAETQYNRETAKIDGNITFDSGSAHSILAGVEHRTGTVANQPFQVNPASYAGNRVTVRSDNISIISCKLYYVDIDAAQDRNNIFILRCFFNPGMVVTSGGAGVISNLTVTNCFFRNDYNTAPDNRAVILAAAGTQAGWRISQCTFYNSFSVTSTHTTFNNNAFFGASAAVATVAAHPNNTYSNNVMNFNVTASITDGVNSNTIRTEAVGAWFSQAGASDAADIYYTAAASTSACPLRDVSSPGDNSLSKGMYGGGAPYAPSGMFTVPSVYDIQMDAEVGDNFNMIIKARTH
jgi:hypothetical protein